MKDFFKVLRRFIPPYKTYLIRNMFFNILSAILNLFSFALIIPILNILFQINQKIYTFKPWYFDGTSISWWKSFPEIFSNNFLYYVSHLINTKGGSFTLIILGVILIVSTFLKVMSMYAAFYNMIPIRTGVARDIRNHLYDKITALPLKFFSEERKGDIIARFSGDVQEIETSVLSSLDMLLKNPVLIIIYLIALITISWQLTLFVLVLLPIAGYVMGQVGKRLKRSSLKGQNQWGDLMTIMEETLGGLRIIKAFRAEKRMQKNFKYANEAYRNTLNKVYRRQQMAHPMSEFLGTTTIAIVLWFGGTLILQQNSPIDASTFIYYLVIFYSIINPAKDLAKATYAIQKGMASMIRVDKILMAKNNILDAKKPILLNLKQEIRYHDVWFRYQQDWILKGINLEIPKGKTIALVGQSGSGKSTAADLLPRFYDIQKGQIMIDGIDIRKSTVGNLRELLGSVSQEAILFNDTFYNNITFGNPHATKEEVIQAAKIANAHDFIIATEHGYETRVGDRGGKLSGGQRQRISIARAVLKNPPILILDEATSALDTESERLVQEAIENLTRDRTTIVIAHRLSTIRKASCIYVMKEGEIVEKGKHDELLKLKGYYKRLCDMQELG